MHHFIKKTITSVVTALLLTAGSAAIAAAPASKPEVAKAEQSASDPAAAVTVDEKVSINTATAEDLVKHLKGIGSKKAEAIVSYREQYGAFTSIEQLQEVPGIGPSIMERNISRLKL